MILGNQTPDTRLWEMFTANTYPHLLQTSCSLVLICCVINTYLSSQSVRRTDYNSHNIALGQMYSFLLYNLHITLLQHNLQSFEIIFCFQIVQLVKEVIHLWRYLFNSYYGPEIVLCDGQYSVKHSCLCAYHISSEGGMKGI